MVNEEICDLLNRKSRTVDLAFQRVQEPIVQEISSLAILADRLFKDIQSAKIVKAREPLTLVIKSIALVAHANWKLKIKRRESLSHILTHLTLDYAKTKSSPQLSCSAMI